MNIIKTVWKGFWDGWNDYVRRMAAGQFCHFLPILGAIASGISAAKGGSDLFKQILGGIGGAASAMGQQDESAEEKAKAEYGQREKYETSMMDKRRKMYTEEGFKPQTPRYEIQKDLGIFDPMIKSAVMGSFKDIFGADTVARWGMDFDKMGQIAAERSVAAEAQETKQPMPMQAQPKIMEGDVAMRGLPERPWGQEMM